MRCESGNPCIMGCNRIENGYNFAYDCSKDTDIKLCFFDRDTLELKEEIPLKKRMGTVYSVCVCDDNIERMLYCYKADDEYIVDPYAKAVTGCEVFGVEQENTLHLSPVKLESFNWEGDVPLHLPYNDCVFYKLNVRGFTKSRSSKVKAKGTFRGIVEKIPYLKELGITTIVSLNPIMVDGTGMCGACRVMVGDEVKFACVDGPEFDGHLVDFDQAMKRQQMYKTEEGRALLKLREGDTHHGGCGNCSE